MAPRVKPSSRPYRSVLRQQQAEDTRRRVLDAAATLFVRHGYSGTTINALAAEAGVSPETIYVSFGGKKGVLEGLIDSTITEFLAPLRNPEGDEPSRWRDIDRLRNPRRRLRAFVDFVCEILAHTSPIHAIIRGAADSEPFAVALRQRLLETRLAEVRTWVWRSFGEALRPGLTVEEAGERAGALLSPELHHLLIVDMGWRAEQHRRWVGDLLEAELLRA